MTSLDGMTCDDATALASDINTTPAGGYATIKCAVPPPDPRYIVIVYNAGPAVPFDT